MPDGGEIRVECSCDPATIHIRITDSGFGLPEDGERHLFEPFWTTKPAGTGLGLAISYRIIEAHGGSLSAESPPGGGCTFIIALPVKTS